MAKIEAIWKEGMHFEVDAPGGFLQIDAAEEAGGKGKGNRPKALMLVALAGCTGIDVRSLLNKMRVETNYFAIKVSAELSEEHPKYYTSTHLTYIFKGEDLDEEKIKKAIHLSFSKYCGVIYMFKQFSEITWELNINSQVIP